MDSPNLHGKESTNLAPEKKTGSRVHDSNGELLRRGMIPSISVLGAPPRSHNMAICEETRTPNLSCSPSVSQYQGSASWLHYSLGNEGNVSVNRPNHVDPFHGMSTTLFSSEVNRSRRNLGLKKSADDKHGIVHIFSPTPMGSAAPMESTSVWPKSMSATTMGADKSHLSLLSQPHRRRHRNREEMEMEAEDAAPHGTFESRQPLLDRSLRRQDEKPDRTNMVRKWKLDAETDPDAPPALKSAAAPDKTPKGGRRRRSEGNEDQEDAEGEERGEEEHRCSNSSRETRKWCCNLVRIRLSWVLTTYGISVILLGLVAFLSPYYVIRNNIMESSMTYHDYIRLEVESQLHAALDIPYALASVLLGLHVRSQWHSSPGDAMPMGFEMSQRLCAALQQVDQRKILTTVYVASSSRNEMALCTRGFHPTYLAVLDMTLDNGTLYRFFAMNPETLELLQPLHVLMTLNRPRSVYEITNVLTNTGQQLSEWKSDVLAGRDPGAKMWSVETFPRRQFSFTHPFLEKDGNVSFIKLLMRLGRVMTTIYEANPNLPESARILVMENSVEKMTVLGNNWKQEIAEEVHNNANDLNTGNFGAQNISRQPTLNEISDPLMSAALHSVNIRGVFYDLGITGFFTTSFRYESHAFGATLTASLVHTRNNGSVVVLIAVPTDLPRSFENSTKNMMIMQIFITVAVIVGVNSILFFCVVRPLHRMATNLRTAVQMNPVNIAHPSIPSRCTKHPWSLLSEMRSLQDECATLQNQLGHLRSFLPQSLFEEVRSSGLDLTVENRGRPLDSNSIFSLLRRTPSATLGLSAASFEQLYSLSDTTITGTILTDVSEINVFKEVTCTVVFVCISNPQQAVQFTGEMASAVVQASKRYGGCIDVLLPELFEINFGARQRSETDPIQATRCAMSIYDSLSPELRAYCAILVETGSFFYGVCGGPDRKEFVLWKQEDVLDLVRSQMLHGIPFAISDSTVTHIRNLMRPIPIAIVTRKASRRLLYTVLDDDMEEFTWQTAEASYTLGFRQLTDGHFTAAIACFEPLLSLPRVSPKLHSIVEGLLKRLHAIIVAPRPINPFTLSLAQSVTTAENTVTTAERLSDGRDPPQLYSATENSTCSGLDRTRDARREAEAEAEKNTAVEQNGARAPSTAAPPALTAPTSFHDMSGNAWTRSAESQGDNCYVPVFLGISDAGTLATLKVLSPTYLASLRVEALEVAWARGKTLYHENIVQLLDYGHAAGYVFLIMEYVPGGTLRDTLRRYSRSLPLPAIRRCLVCTLRALEYLHNRGFVHGDVRPENIMMGVEGRCKLKGMDALLTVEESAKEVAALEVEKLWGSHGYESPEIRGTGRRTAAADIYAAGQTLLEAVGSGILEGGEDAPEMSADVMLREALRSCLEENEWERKTASELLQMLSHMR